MGLLTFSHALDIFVQLTVLREKSIMLHAKEDFGVDPLPDYEERIKEWAIKSFRDASKDDRVPVWLAGEWELQPRAAQLLRAPERSEQDGGLTLRLIRMVNFLGNVIVDSYGKGYIAENDLNQANDYLDYVIPLLPPS